MFSSAPHLAFHSSNERAMGEKKCWPTDYGGFSDKPPPCPLQPLGPALRPALRTKVWLCRETKALPTWRPGTNHVPSLAVFLRYPLSVPWGEKGSVVKGTELTCRQVESSTKSLQFHEANVFRHFHPSLKTPLNYGDEHSLLWKCNMHFVKHH